MEKEILKGKKILIVEDDLSSRLYLNKILEKTGAALLNAGDGMEAVQIAADNPDLVIILMDIQLPGMDGYASTKKIKESGHNCKIIAQTAYSFPEDMENIRAAGFDDFIVKPVFSDQLIEKITSHFVKK